MSFGVFAANTNFPSDVKLTGKHVGAGEIVFFARKNVIAPGGSTVAPRAPATHGELSFSQERRKPERQ
jgi:hypothetical protein